MLSRLLILNILRILKKAIIEMCKRKKIKHSKVPLNFVQSICRCLFNQKYQVSIKLQVQSIILVYWGYLLLNMKIRRIELLVLQSIFDKKKLKIKIKLEKWKLIDCYFYEPCLSPKNTWLLHAVQKFLIFNIKQISICFRKINIYSSFEEHLLM